MQPYDPDLPDELQGRESRAPVMESVQTAEDRAERLERLSNVIAEKRNDAVKARKDSGIEDVWLACEEAYLCIDELNRPADRAKWAKPTSMVGPVTSNASRGDNKSKAFVRLTARYVDMGAAKISEIILPIGGKAFQFKPTPVPQVAELKEDQTPVTQDGQPVVTSENGQFKALVVGDLAKRSLKQAEDKAKKAEKRVYDWLVESRYPMQMRKVMHDSARIGVGVIKGPFPTMRKASKFSVEGGVEGGVAKLVIEEKIAPAVKWVNPWNFYPHGACGEDIYDGDYVFEMDNIAPATLRDLKNERVNVNGVEKPIYIASQIDKVIKEGPDKCYTDNAGKERLNGEQYKIWYFTGVLTREDFMALEPALDEDLPDELAHVFAVVTMVNDTVIRATPNPLESGKFGYRTFPWSRRAGHWAGVGVGEQVGLPQRIVNAATRRLLDNAGVSAGTQLVIDQTKIVPADGNWTITPDKIWWSTGDGFDDVTKAFLDFKIQNVGDELAAIIQYGFKLAEEASNIPLISQGQTGPNDPQTFGQAELQNSNANTLIRNLAYSVDDHITEPLVTDFYEWLLLDPDVPKDEKGDLQIDARGSIVMVEKAIQEQTLMMMGPLTLNPAFGWSPKKWAEMVARTKRLNPSDLEYSEEELAEMQQQQPPEAPAVTVAKIREEGATQREVMRSKVILQRARMDTDRDTAYTNALTRRDQMTAVTRREELILKREIAYLQAQVSRGINVDTNKVKLAESAMKLRAMQDMAAINGKATQTVTPPVEPAGRAPDGQAFQK